MTQGSLPDRASDDEIERVANELRMRLQGDASFMLEQRYVEFNSKAILSWLSEKDLVEASQQAGTQREKDIIALMAKYGEAVRQVDGADPQDLLFLWTFGVVRLP